MRLRSFIEIASRSCRWCEFPSLLSALSGEGRIRITSPIDQCSRCKRLYEVVCVPCEQDKAERKAEQEHVVRPFRVAGGVR